MQSFHQSADQPRRVYHVWVKLDLEGPRQPEPGLVLDWRQTPEGWEAWVVTIETYSTGRGWASAVRMGWRPLRYLQPAESVPPPAAAWRPPGTTGRESGPGAGR